MADSDKNKQQQNNPKISPVVASVTGAVVGATVAVAGTVALKDKKRREKIKKIFNTVKNQARSYIGDLQEVTEDNVQEILDKGQKEMHAAKDKLPYALKEKVEENI